MHIAHTTKKRGFVILFTVLIASIVLAIALGIASVSYREVLLSSTAKDAEFSFFAADTGAECALYWDIQQAAFAQTLVTPSCHGAPVEMLSSSSPFAFRFPTDVAGCASVTVDKSDPATTKIESLGYNVACTELAANPTNPRIVERAIRVTYGPGQAPDPNANTTATTSTQGPNSSSTTIQNNATESQTTIETSLSNVDLTGDQTTRNQATAADQSTSLTPTTNTAALRGQ